MKYVQTSVPEPEISDEDDEHERESSLDEFQAVDILEVMNFKGADTLVEQMQLAENKAREILEEKRETLDFLANALRDSGKLTFDEIKTIIEINVTRQ